MQFEKECFRTVLSSVWCTIDTRAAAAAAAAACCCCCCCCLLFVSVWCLLYGCSDGRAPRIYRHLPCKTLHRLNSSDLSRCSGCRSPPKALWVARGAMHALLRYTLHDRCRIKVEEARRCSNSGLAAYTSCGGMHDSSSCSHIEQLQSQEARKRDKWRVARTWYLVCIKINSTLLAILCYAPYEYLMYLMVTPVNQHVGQCPFSHHTYDDTDLFHLLWLEERSNLEPRQRGTEGIYAAIYYLVPGTY